MLIEMRISVVMKRIWCNLGTHLWLRKHIRLVLTKFKAYFKTWRFSKEQITYYRNIVMFIDSSDKYDIQIKHNNTI